jgi:hypothetical protein
VAEGDIEPLSEIAADILNGFVVRKNFKRVSGQWAGLDGLNLIGRRAQPFLLLAVPA